MQVTGPLRIGVAAGAVGLALAITTVRFCGGVTLPAKSDPPPETLASSKEALRQITHTEESWLGYIAKDAAAAGVPTPTPDEMARKLVFRVDEAHHSLVPSENPTIEAAGLRLTAVVDGGTLSLMIENLTEADLAYQVVTRPSPASLCSTRTIIAHNAQVVVRRGREERSECEFHDGMSLEIDRVETAELLPLQAFYVSRVPPLALGNEARLARGHEPDLAAGQGLCNVTASQAQRAAVEKGTVAWRDLVDFYARHRCDTYRFPLSYRAFTTDSERPLPASER